MNDSSHDGLSNDMIKNSFLYRILHDFLQKESGKYINKIWPEINPDQIF